MQNGLEHSFRSRRHALGRVQNEGRWCGIPQFVELTFQKRNGKRRLRLRIWLFAVTLEFPSS